MGVGTHSDYVQSKDDVFGLDQEAELCALWNAHDARSHRPAKANPGHDDCTFDCPNCGNELVEMCKFK